MSHTERRRRSRPEPAKGAVAGLLAGLAGTWTITQVQTLFSRAQQQSAQPQSQQQQPVQPQQ